MFEASAAIIIATIAAAQAVVLKRMDTKVRSVDRAVNCVGPGEPRLVEKVDQLLVDSAVIQERVAGLVRRLETLENNKEQ